MVFAAFKKPVIQHHHEVCELFGLLGKEGLGTDQHSEGEPIFDKKTKKVGGRSWRSWGVLQLEMLTNTRTPHSLHASLPRVT